MVRIVLALAVMLCGCQESFGEREARCAEIVESGGNQFDLVDTSDWRVGSLPFWTTPAYLRSTLGEPDYVDPGPPPEDGWSVTAYDRGDRWLSYVEIGDTLAFLSEAFLDEDPLVTDGGLFEPGASLRSARRVFPQSYSCRDWPFQADLWRDEFQTELIVEDPLRNARIGFRFADERLGRVGINWHDPSLERQRR